MDKVDNMKTVKMGEMTVLEVREYLKTNKTIILPYGVVEQHGYHLPLDTDIRNAEVMGGKLAEQLGCIVAPTLNYCFSGGMLEGTINVRPNTFSTMVCEIVESLAMQGFENIIILPGHGGSESMLHLKESLRVMKWLNESTKDLLLLMVPLWDFSPTWLELFNNRDYHGAKAETSLMMYWHPEVVRSEIVLDSDEVAEMMRNDPDSFQVRTRFTELEQEIVTTVQDPRIEVGIMGYPHEASVELGKKINDEILNNAVPVLQAAITQANEARKTGERITVKDDDKLKILN
jgi:creatinine amidohydrolase